MVSKPMSSWEAENVYQDIMNKDFWTTDLHEHLTQLQGMLDVLFNSKEGNRYKADYAKTQSTERIIIKCLVCNKELSSFDPFKSHNDGKIHKKAVQQSLTCEDPNIIGTLVFKPLNKVKNKFPDDSLEDRIDKTSHLIVGVSFLYRELIDDEEYFVCDLCKTRRYSSDRMFQHLTADNHRKNYVSVAFPHWRGENINGILEDIELQEGRIHEAIITLRTYTEMPKKRDPDSPLPSTSKAAAASISASDLPPKFEELKKLNDATTMREFVKELDVLDDRNHRYMITKLLLDDKDSQGIIVSSIKCLADKFHKFATDHDKEILRETKKIKDKCDSLTAPI